MQFHQRGYFINRVDRILMFPSLFAIAIVAFTTRLKKTENPNRLFYETPNYIETKRKQERTRRNIGTDRIMLKYVKTRANIEEQSSISNYVRIPPSVNKILENTYVDNLNSAPPFMSARSFGTRRP